MQAVARTCCGTRRPTPVSEKSWESFRSTCRALPLPRLLPRRQVKCRHFQAADQRKFQAVWAMKQAEALELLDKLMQVGSRVG